MKNTFTTILDWMYDLGLTLPELVCYATIFGFSQDGESAFTGSRRFLARKMCAKSRTTVDKALARLIELGLIDKQDYTANGVKFCRYFANLDAIPGNQPAAEEPSQEPATGRVSNRATTGKVRVEPLSLARDVLAGTEFETNHEFLQALTNLMNESKWRNKSENAWRMNLRKLVTKPLPVAIEMVNRTIANGWQGLFDLKPYEVDAIMGVDRRLGDNRPYAHRPSLGGVTASEEMAQGAMTAFNNAQ